MNTTPSGLRMKVVTLVDIDTIDSFMIERIMTTLHSNFEGSEFNLMQFTV